MDLKYKIQLEFESLLKRIDNKMGKIISYLNREKRDKPKVIKAATQNFYFSYTIFTDCTSKMEINVLKKYDRKYDADFLLSKLKNEIGYVYFLKSQFGIKIGCTRRLENRMKSFGVKLPFKVELHSFVKYKNYASLEQKLHILLSHKRINGEWFGLSDEDFQELDLFLLNMKLKRETQ